MLKMKKGKGIDFILKGLSLNINKDMATIQ